MVGLLRCCAGDGGRPSDQSGNSGEPLLNEEGAVILCLYAWAGVMGRFGSSRKTSSAGLTRPAPNGCLAPRLVRRALLQRLVQKPSRRARALV
jgi:hypothetical protein